MIKTFAIISHPDAGKTTFTEQLLYVSGAINQIGAVKSKKTTKAATSDWMAMEQERGISVSTSALKFYYKNLQVNLLDTPGHGDFSEDTYRTLSAVDCALMIIDAAKGVEDRTIKLMEVCRLRNIPIFTFINKLDRETKEPFDLLDEIEKVLKLTCVPKNWPISSGKSFKGLWDLSNKSFISYKNRIYDESEKQQLNDDIEMINGAVDEFSKDKFLNGQQTPVFFGSAINTFGMDSFLNAFIELAPFPTARESSIRLVAPDEKKLTGFTFKIQSNMDPKHHDRIAFLRIVSGTFTKGMKLFHVRSKKKINIKAVDLFGNDRNEIEEAHSGDIIGIHNYGNINVGDTFTQGESLRFLGIPSFAPLLFKSIRSTDPLKQKALLKGVMQLCEEGATQLFRPIIGNNIILGAIGPLQFDVVMHRLKNEYKVDCILESSTIATVRWVNGDLKEHEEFLSSHLAHDVSQRLVYLAPSMSHLYLWQDKLKNVKLNSIQELAEY